MDTVVNLGNLVRAGYGYGGSKLGLLGANDLPEPVNPQNIPGTSAYTHGLLGVGDTIPEQGAEILGGLLSPGPKIAKAPTKIEITAYHGSPHTFDKFDMSKIGTGEGAQAYGHGLYFAEQPEVAKQYQDALKWRGTDWNDPNIIATQAAEKYGDRKAAADAMRWALEQNSKSPNPMQAASNEVTKKAISILDNGAPLTGKPPSPGNMYKVDIPDEHVAKMLDWDKPLSEQHPQVQGLLSKIGIKNDPELLKEASQQRIDAFDRMIKLERSLGQDDPKYLAAYKDFKLAQQDEDRVKTLMAGTGADIYRSAGKSNESSTANLRSVGIPGIRYLDAGSRGVQVLSHAETVSGEWIAKQIPNGNVLYRGTSEKAAREAGKGSSNFVLFDDKLPKILSRE
jgi:hypothetical protein